MHSHCPLPTVGFQTELVVNTSVVVSDVHHGVTNTHTIVSTIQNDVANTQSVVSDVHEGVTNTQAIVSELQHNVTSTHTIVSDIHRAIAKGREEADDNNLPVSTCTLSIAKSTLTVV